ncbi:hypothetical protein [Dickeya dadantii]|uniref:hypothetical protein n=1 Tax=Dickeya dadantii TaxID=204038 RepID=UPI0020A670F1|nr:hypothetical protein [Dickeya dadantii]
MISHWMGNKLIRINQQGVMMKCNAPLNRLLLIVLFVPFFSWSSKIVHGPFSLDKKSEILFIEKDDNNVVLLQKDQDKQYIIDTYEPEGDNAHIDTVFFINLERARNIIVLVSWKQYHPGTDIDGTLYEIKGYRIHNGILRLNNRISKDNKLSGFDGINQNSKFTFKYKTYSDIKTYLKNNE